MTADNSTPEGARKRSPGYPAIDLRSAIDRTVDLYKVSPRHPIPLNVAAEEWGFSPTSSSSKVVAAALKQFGLVRDVGAGEARQLALTEEGRELGFGAEDRDSSRWHELVKEIALKPRIYRQVLDHFEGSLPDDRVVLRFLLFERGFVSEASAKDFLTRFKSTLTFAHLPDERDLDRRDSAEGPDEFEYSASRNPVDQSEPPAQRLLPPEWTRADQKAVQIPYSQEAWATLQAAFPLTEDEWDALLTMLQAMRPGLVARTPSLDREE